MARSRTLRCNKVSCSSRRIDVDNVCERSFTNAKARKDDAEQIVRGEFAGDRSKRLLRFAQFLGEQLHGRFGCCNVCRCRLEMRGRAFQSLHMPCARNERVLADVFRADD